MPLLERVDPDISSYFELDIKKNFHAVTDFFFFKTFSSGTLQLGIRALLIVLKAKIRIQ